MRQKSSTELLGHLFNKTNSRHGLPQTVAFAAMLKTILENVLHTLQPCASMYSSAAHPRSLHPGYEYDNHPQAKVECQT